MSEDAAEIIGLGLGSNEGDRIANMAAARDRIAALPDTRLLAQSSLYETEPVGVKPEYQHLKFVNAVLLITTDLSLAMLHEHLLAVEEVIGRCRTEDKFAPRPLDIDILFAGVRTMATPTLKLPHPQCLKRRFVLEPLAEIDPDRVLPTTAQTVRDLLAGLPEGEPVIKLSVPW